MELNVGDIVLCQVDRIIGTTVFVKIEGTNEEGSIVFSEISPGRIRNIRDFVVPKKTIVCKVLKEGNSPELSLRRVTPKEKKERLEKSKLEKSYTSIIRSVIKEKTPEVLKQIQKESPLYDFLEESKEDSKKLEEIVGKESSKRILDILSSQKTKLVSLKKEIKFNSQEPDGLEIIKKSMSDLKDVKITYLAAGKYSIKAEDESVKNAAQKIKVAINQIEKIAKENKVDFVAPQ